MKMYIVRDENAKGDTFEDVFENICEANDAALRQWERLTDREKKDRSIDVYFVTENDIDTDLVDDDLTPEDKDYYLGYTSLNQNEQCFSSAKYEAEKARENKTYYFPDEAHAYDFFGASDPVCVDAAELARLAEGWGMDFDDLMEQVHEATANEIETYGVYDS